MSQGRTHRVGVVAIGRNEGDRLRRCLESSRDQADRLVYVDSGSTDDSVAVARELNAEVVQLDLLRPFTAARARNEGILRLREVEPDLEFVQVIDGDCEMASGWIDAALAELSADTRVALVCGRRWERYPRLSVWNKLCDLEWDGPCGDVKSCGGDAMIRMEAIEQVGGYDESLIAGEEPEWCVRLRGAGWRVRRIDQDMTLHDAQMTRCGQWCRRAVRCGHAYAEGRALHGRSAERFRVREVRSILLWGLLLPLLALGLARWTWGASLVLLAPYAVLFWRVYRDRVRQGDDRGDALLYARFCVLGKFPQLAGVLQYSLNRLLGRRSGIIEYKDAGKPAPSPPRARLFKGMTGRILYVGGTLPSRSETFVYREVLALRERGLEVAVASVHSPQRALGDETLEALAGEAVEVYGPGSRRLLADAGRALLRGPGRAARVLARGLADALVGGDLPLAKRPRVLWQTLGGLALGHRLRGRSIAHVHAHMAHVQTTIAMYAALYLGVPFSFTGHAVDLFAERAMLAQKLRRAAFAVAISHWHRAFYQRIVGRATDDLPLVRCGVDVSRFRPVEGATRDDPDRCRVLAVGRLVPKKGFDVLIEAIARLAREGIRVPCTIVGDGPEMAALRRLRLEQGISDLIDLQGAQSNEVVLKSLAGADLFVLPCRIDARGDRDGIPVVLMEAMACGVCAVSGDLVTIRELIEHGRNGMLVRPGSVEALVEVLRELAADPARRRALAHAGRQRVEAEFALDLNADRLFRAFTGEDPEPAGRVPGAKPASPAKTRGKAA